MKHGLAEFSLPTLASSPISVTLADESGREDWEQFVATCPSATFFHKFGWKEVIEKVFRHRTYFLMAKRGSVVEGVLPLAELKSVLFGHGLSSLPISVYGGVASVTDEATQALTQAAVELARSLGVGHMELRNRAPCNPQWPTQDLHVSFSRPLLPEEEANMLAIPRKQRAMVRKGIKAGLCSEIDADVDRFFALYSDNMLRHGTPPYGRRYFKALKEVFGEEVEVLTVVSPEGQPLSSVVSFYFRDEVLPYYAGDDVRARELAANDFKYWELMRRACARGLSVFDFGRSKRDSGSFHFKKNWGFEPVPLHYEYWLAKGDRIPQHNPANPKYQLFIRAWRKLPLGVANTIGPCISKYLG